MKRKTSRTPWRRPLPSPAGPPVIPEPPAPSVLAPAEERRRRRRRRAPTPAEQVAQAVEAYPGIPAGPGLSIPTTPTITPLLQELYQRQVTPYGTVAGPGITMPRAWVGAELMRRPVAPTRKTAAQLAAEYGGEPTELWFLREDLGGRAGRAGEIWKAWAGGGRPQFVPKSAAEIMGVHEDQMREAGYERTLGGSWQATLPSRPALQPPPSYGGSYGYTPSRYGRGGGGVRGQAAARGMGLINWRIGL